MSDEQAVKAVFNPVDRRIVVHRSEAEQGMATVREVSAGLLDAYQRASGSRRRRSKNRAVRTICPRVWICATGPAQAVPGGREALPNR